METYHRNIVYKRDKLTGALHPSASFPFLTDALTYADQQDAVGSAIYAYEVFDLENLSMGDMRTKFRVEDNELVER